MLDSMTTTPAFVRNGRLDILAINALGRALYARSFDDPDAGRRTWPGSASSTRAPRDFYPDWDDAAHTTVALLRTEAGRDPYNRDLTALVGELATRSDEFRTRWAAHDVRLHRTGTKHFHHPVVGAPRPRLRRHGPARRPRADPHRLHRRTRLARRRTACGCSPAGPRPSRAPTPPTRLTTPRPARTSDATAQARQPHRQGTRRAASPATSTSPRSTTASEPSRMTVALVRFTPGAHTNWHPHAVGQTLHVTEGVGLVGTRDGTVLRIRAGDTVVCPPDEDHWHGAAADTFMSHLAMLEANPTAATPPPGSNRSPRTSTRRPMSRPMTTEPTAAPAPDEPAAGSTAIRVRIAETVLTARLRDVPASRDLIARLPLTLTFRDFNGVEKISRLPRELSMDGVPTGDDPAPRDIGYYAPSGDLVFYYGDVGYFPGLSGWVSST